MAQSLVAAAFIAFCGLATASECGVLRDHSRVGMVFEEPALGGARPTAKDNLDLVAALQEDDVTGSSEQSLGQESQAAQEIAGYVSLFQDFFLFGLAFVVFCAWKYFTNAQASKSATPAKNVTETDDLSGPADEVDDNQSMAPLNVDNLVQAMYSDNIGGLRKLLGERSVNARDEVCCCTALHMAAHCSCMPAAEALLARGADVNVRDAWDETPFHFAARAGNVKVCSLLLQHGADANAGNLDGCTPLVAAAEAGKAAVCEWLLDHGAHTGGMDEEDVPSLLTKLLHKRILQAM